MSSENGRPFSISGFGAGFADRQRDLFACLDAAERQRDCKRPPDPPLEMEVVDYATQNRKRKMPMKSFQGKESIFKRPEMPPPRRARQGIPDHQRNPHKWTKYSLGDVSPQDMSERSNTVTALAFLRELQARKDQEACMDIDTPAITPIRFQAVKQRVDQYMDSMGETHTVSSSQTSEEGERPSFHRSKVVMPEYVVGEKKIRKRNVKAQHKSSDSNKIVLDHLLDENE